MEYTKIDYHLKITDPENWLTVGKDTKIDKKKIRETKKETGFIN